jgi:hypothetical protein
MLSSCIFIALGSSLAISLLFASARAQEENAQCIEEVFNISKEMHQMYGLNVAQPGVGMIYERSSPFPGSFVREFPVQVDYGYEGRYPDRATFRANNFMNSPNIQLRMAKSIMTACPSTSKVVFGILQSGHWIAYFRMPSGQIRQGVSLGCGYGTEDRKLQWGYYYLC